MLELLKVPYTFRSVSSKSSRRLAKPHESGPASHDQSSRTFRSLQGSWKVLFLQKFTRVDSMSKFGKDDHQMIDSRKHFSGNVSYVQRNTEVMVKRGERRDPVKYWRSPPDTALVVRYGSCWSVENQLLEFLVLKGPGGFKDSW